MTWNTDKGDDEFLLECSFGCYRLRVYLANLDFILVAGLYR